MRIKQGVKLGKIQPVMAIANTVVESVFQKFNSEAVITSGEDGIHRDDSKHYTGNALDYRTKHLPRGFPQKIERELKNALGAEFDVVLEYADLENEHLHVEFDPKE